MEKRLPLIVLTITLCGTVLASCNAPAESATIYALTTSSTNPAHFAQDLEALVTTRGLRPHRGQATDDKGRTLYVLEAKGHGMRLWSQNLPLDSGDTKSPCGDRELDPGQYIITVSPTLPFVHKGETAELASQVGRELARLGYGVRSQPVPCSIQ
jgi:hypothetical protein